MQDEENGKWRFHHLGVIVRDIEKAVKYWQNLGTMDPPRPTVRTDSPPTWVEYIVDGKIIIKDGNILVPQKPGSNAGFRRWCQVGTILVELTQPGEGGTQTSQNDFLDKVGEGVDHIAYYVDARYFDEEVEKMKAKGFQVLMSAKQSNGGGFIYFDTSKSGGLIIALMKAL